MAENIIIGLFTLVMLANCITIARHWVMMRALTHALRGLVQTQQEFFEIAERERGKQG